MEDYRYEAAPHHHGTNPPIQPKCVPVPMKCGLCEYSTADISDLVDHTSTHVMQRHPFKCTACLETFPGYIELQQHPCGDAQFAFLLSTPQTDKNPDISDIPEGEAVDLSTVSRKRNQNMNIVYGSASPKRCKSDDGQDEASVTDEKIGAVTSRSPMTLRTRVTPRKDNACMKDDELEGDVQTRQQSENIQRKKTPGRPIGKDYKGKNPLMSCTYCNFETGYPGNLKSHLQLHQKPGRQHYECQVCELKFLTPKQQKTHDCGLTKRKTPKLTPGLTKLKTQTLRPKPDITRLKTPRVKPELPQMKTPAQPPDVSKKLGSKFNASLARAAKGSAENVYVCRLCDFMALSKCNVTQHVYRHRCVFCHDYFPTTSKRTNHMSRCKKTIVTYTGEQQITNIRGEMVTYRQDAPRTLVNIICVRCEGRFQHCAELQVHRCTTKKLTKAPSSKSTAAAKPPKSDVQKKASQTKGKVPRGLNCGSSSSSSKKPRGKMEGYDEKLQMYSCKFCVFTHPTPLALLIHLKSHDGTETLLQKTPALQAQRLEFARQKERERTKPRMEGWDEEAMQYVCDICGFGTPAPIAFFNHKKFHKVAQDDDQKVWADNSEVQGEDQEEELQEEESFDVSVDDEDEEEEDVVIQDSNIQERESSKWLMCEMCDFTTTRRWNLQAHAGLHTGARPFKCRDCNIGFTDHFYLKVHLMKLHGKEDGDTESEPVIETGPQPGKTEPCPQPGCGFKSNSTTAFTEHFKQHLLSMSTNNDPDLLYTPDITRKGKTTGGSNTSPIVTPTTATAKRLSFADTGDDRLNRTNSPEVRLNRESPKLIIAELSDKASCGTSLHTDPVASSTSGMRHRDSAVASPSWMPNAAADFKVLQPVESYLPGPSGNSMVDTGELAPTGTSQVGAEPPPQTESVSGPRCSSEHLEASHPELTPRSAAGTPTGQSLTEEIGKDYLSQVGAETPPQTDSVSGHGCSSEHLEASHPERTSRSAAGTPTGLSRTDKIGKDDTSQVGAETPLQTESVSGHQCSSEHQETSYPKRTPRSAAGTPTGQTLTEEIGKDDTSQVGAETPQQTESVSGNRCSSEHQETSHPEHTPRSTACSPTGQTHTEETGKDDEMPVLQTEVNARTDVVPADVGKSAQGLVTEDKENRSPCSAADATPSYPPSPQRSVGSGRTQELRGVWRRPGSENLLQIKSCMQLFPKSTPNTTSATDSDAADTDCRADGVTPSVIEGSPHHTQPSMCNTSNVEQPIIGTSADGHITTHPLRADSHIAKPIPLYWTAAPTVTPDNTTESIIDSSSISTRPIIDTSPNDRIATRPIINSSPADTHRIIDTSPYGRVATRPLIPLDLPYHHGGQPSPSTAGGMGAGSRSLGSLHRCGFCAVYFEDLRLFLHHMGRHHPDHPWTCTGCWKNFRNVLGFIDHH